MFNMLFYEAFLVFLILERYKFSKIKKSYKYFLKSLPNKLLGNLLGFFV